MVGICASDQLWHRNDKWSHHLCQKHLLRGIKDRKLVIWAGYEFCVCRGKTFPTEQCLKDLTNIELNILLSKAVDCCFFFKSELLA